MPLVPRRFTDTFDHLYVMRLTPARSISQPYPAALPDLGAQPIPPILRRHLLLPLRLDPRDLQPRCSEIIRDACTGLPVNGRAPYPYPLTFVVQPSRAFRPRALVRLDPCAYTRRGIRRRGRLRVEELDRLAVYSRPYRML
jgi:hypothetical protein